MPGSTPDPTVRRPGHVPRPRRVSLPAGTRGTVTGLAALVTCAGLLAACTPGSDGLRTDDSSAPPAASRPTAAPSPSPSASYHRVDVLKLLRDDPRVSATVRRTLAHPCSGGQDYPVDVTYASLTGGAERDLVVNVMTCADSVGIASYVYRRQPSATATPTITPSGSTPHATSPGPGRGSTASPPTPASTSPAASASPVAGYVDVFQDEQPPVYAGIDKGELQITKQTYAKGDKVCCPSGEDVMTYHWTGGRFVEYDLYHTDFNKSVDGQSGGQTDDPDGSDG